MEPGVRNMSLKVRHKGYADWLLILIALLVLGVYFYYTIAYIFRVPYPGIEITAGIRGWTVNESIQPGVEIGAVLGRIGDLTDAQYTDDRLSVPFEGAAVGEKIAVELIDNGGTILLEMPKAKIDDRFRRFIATFWFFPFWLAGSIVLLFLRPRDSRWRLLVAFFYLISIWAILGTIANWQVAGSRILYGACSWLLLPVTIHLHLIVPRLIFPRIVRYFVPVLYVVSLILVVLEITQIAPRQFSTFGFVFALLVSFGLLIYRLVRPATLASERIVARLMLTGIALAFIPGIMIVFVPTLLQVPVANELALAIAYLAIPILPFFYVYAIYKHQLGVLEFRANRLLSQYSFILLFPPVLLILMLFGMQFIASPSGQTVYFLAIAIIFVIAIPFLFDRIQRWVNQLAYGTKYDPDEIIRVFADQIPSAFSRDDLVRLLNEDILPSLLIRQSLLYAFEDDQDQVWYAQGVDVEDQRPFTQPVKHLLSQADQYVSSPEALQPPWHWVRLVIPLKTRQTTLGVWLFGRRDPDDFYPQADIDLLQALSNQIAPVLENIRLYEAVRRQADNLAEEVTERTKELRRERDRTQAILDSAGEGVYFMSLEGIIMYANPALLQMTGYVEEELFGQPLNVLGSDASAAEMLTQIWTAVQARRGWHGEIRQQRKDGEPYDARLTIAPIEVGDDQVSGFVAVQSDISKLKEVDRLKSNIIANVSHELKTPLANISLYLQLLERGKPKNQERYIEILNQETDRLTRLIRDLLDLSMLDSGDLPVQISSVDLDSLVKKVVDAYQKRAQAHQIDLSTNLPDNLPSVMADYDQLEQVFINLLVNAIMYTPEGGQVVWDSGHGSLDTVPAVWVRVTDTGFGIAPEEMDQLYDRFYRGQASQKSKAPGTGLGLTICMEIIARHQGKIEIESELDQGTAVSVWLPTVNGNDDGEC